jgi:hydroxyacylglutathione hydrolase
MLNINILNAFEDNYIFLLECSKTDEIAVVDPGDADVVIKALNGKRLNKILLTHHHYDHVGGVDRLCEVYNCDVYGYKGDKHRLPSVTHWVDDGDLLKVGDHSAKVIFVPGHTLGHVSYYFAGDEALFCGDTLFVGGCGRLFEGSAEDMFNSLVKYKSLPLSTKIYCAHEYTLSNYEFALNMFPDDRSVLEAKKRAIALRTKGLPTVPTTFGNEALSNVFYRAKTVEELARLRCAKDKY